MTLTSTSPPGTPPAGATPDAPAGAPSWQVWTCLWIVYVIWGSTYLAIRIMVETVPPLLGASARFTIAGLVMLGVLALRRGWSVLRPTREQLLGAGLVGLLLPGANAVVSVAEQEVPSSIAALLIASVPLWVIIMRTLARDGVSRNSVAATLVGFGGVALLVHPGSATGDATIVGLLACVGAALMWASGSFASPRVALPGDPLVSVSWQMLLGGLAILVVGLLAGEASEVRPEAFSTRSVLAVAYLIVFGSWVAYSAYGWLLQNAPISRVATYAYVNPVVAIVLGWLVLDEVVTGTTLAGAAIIIASVALVIRIESPRRRR